MTLAEAERAMLAEAVEAARQVRRRLQRTLLRLDARLPLDAERLTALDDDGQMEVHAILMQWFPNICSRAGERAIDSRPPT